MFKIKKDNKGFTLLEIIIAVAILSIVMVGIYSFLNSSSIMSNTFNAQAKRQNAVDTTMQYIRGRIANATYLEVLESNAYETPESGYIYLYCGPDGGVTVKYPVGSTGWREDSLNTINDLKNTKVYVSFEKNSPMLTGEYKGLNITLFAVPYFRGCPFEETGTNDYTPAIHQSLVDSGTKYRFDTVMTFHNTETIISSDSLSYVKQRCIRFQLPDGASLGGTPVLEPPEEGTVDFSCTVLPKNKETNPSTGMITYTYTVKVKNDNSEEMKGNWSEEVHIGVDSGYELQDSPLNCEKKDAEHVVVRGTNFTLGGGEEHVYDIEVYCMPVMSDFVVTVGDAVLKETLDTGDKKYTVDVTVTNNNAIAVDKEWVSEDKLLGIDYPATSVSTSDPSSCICTKIAWNKFKFNGRNNLAAGESKTIVVDLYCEYVATPMPKNITILADTKNYIYEDYQSIGLVNASTETIPYNNNGGLESKSIVVQPNETLTVYAISTGNVIKNQQTFNHEDLQDGGVIYVQGRTISLTQPANWMQRPAANVTATFENAQESRIDSETVQIKGTVVIRAGSMVLNGDDYEAVVDFGVVPLEPSVGIVSGNGIVITGKATNDVYTGNEVARINDVTYKLKKSAPMGSMTFWMQNPREQRIDDNTVKVICDKLVGQTGANKINQGEPWTGAIDAGYPVTGTSQGDISGNTITFSGTASNNWNANQNYAVEYYGFWYTINKPDTRPTIDLSYNLNENWGNGTGRGTLTFTNNTGADITEWKASYTAGIDLGWTDLMGKNPNISWSISGKTITFEGKTPIAAGASISCNDVQISKKD